MTNLLTLPTEVIDLISGNLCTCQLCNPSNEARDYQETRRALCALSATCRILRNLVQPLLYHRVYPFHGQVEFARTLVDSPRLASCVRELYYHIAAYEDRSKRVAYPSVNKHAYTKPGWFEEVDVDALFTRLMSEQPGGFYDEEGQETGRGQIKQPFAWHLVDKLLEGSCVLENCLFIRILKMVPDLQVLSLWSSSNNLEHESLSLPPRLLPQLKEFRIFPDSPTWAPFDHQLPSLAAATPMLESVHHFCTESILLERHQNVSELVLTKCGSGQYETFEEIASGFPGLRKLTYTERSTYCGRPRNVTVRAICKALEPIAGTLEVFNIELLGRDDISLEMNHSVSLHDSYRGGLSKMRNLRRLGINGTCLEDLMAKSQDAPLFPSSLTCLKFFLTRMPSAVYLQLQYWAPKCRKDCPNLAKVSLCGALQDIQRSQASDLGTMFRNAQVASDFVEDADLDELLLRAHKLDSINVMWNHDHPPGWEFWNPYVEPMTLVDQTEH